MLSLVNTKLRNITPTALILGLCLTALAASQPVYAQEKVENTRSRLDEEQKSLNSADIQVQISQLEQLQDSEKNKASNRLKFLKSALNSLSTAEDIGRQVEGLKEKIKQVPEQIEAIKRELQQPPGEDKLKIEKELSLAEVEKKRKAVEDALTEERSRVEVLRQDIRGRAERKAKSVSDLDELQKELKKLETKLLSSNVETNSVDGPAERKAMLARRKLLLKQINLNQINQELDQVTSELLPRQVDLALRKIRQNEGLLQLWSDYLAKRRREEAEATERENERLRLMTARNNPKLRELAERNLELARSRTGQDGITLKIEQAVQTLSSKRNLLSGLEQRFERTRSKIRAAGLTSVMGLFLRKQLSDLPDLDKLHENDEQRHNLVSDVQYSWLLLEDEREKYGDVERRVKQLVTSISGNDIESSSLALEIVARELLQARRNVLDLLISDHRKYFELLVELNKVDQALQKTTTDFRSFIRNRIIRIKNVQNEFNWQDVKDFSGWLLSWTVVKALAADCWREIVSSWRFGAMIILVIICVNIASWILIILKIRRHRQQEKPETSVVSGFIRQGIGLTALAAITPFSLWLLAYTMSGSKTLPEIAGAYAVGLRVVAPLQFNLLLVYCLFSLRHYYDESTFVRRAKADAIVWHLRWFSPLFLFLVFLTAVADSSFAKSTWNDSAGRLFFAIEQCLNAVLFYFLIRPSYRRMMKESGSTSYMARSLAISANIAILLPAALLCLSLLGYHYAAIRINVGVFESAVLVAIALLFNHIHSLWYSEAKRDYEAEVDEINQQKEKEEEEHEADANAAEQLLESGEEEDSYDLQLIKLQRDFGNHTDQARIFTNSVIWLFVFLGFYGVWIDFVPVLSRLDELQLYPKVAWVEADNTVLSSPGQAPQDQKNSSNDKADPAAATNAVSATIEAVESAQFTRITLADVSFAFFTVVLTLILMQNLPALMDVAILRYLPFDSGGRYAISTVLGYLILGIGLSVALSNVGISWSNIQWLAAALTFGIGFGLQEIVANFISGLILLFERPIRVGDLVTVGELTGTVTRIRIRATTIRDRDQKELIIPNKTFVTDRVLNWMHSDAVTRVVIKVGVAYGSNLRKVSKVLERVAASHHLVLNSPKSEVHFLGFGDSCLDFEVWAFISRPDQIFKVKTQLHMRIDYQFRHHGIEISFPQRDLHLRSIDSNIKMGKLPIEVTKFPPIESPKPQKSESKESSESDPADDSKPDQAKTDQAKPSQSETSQSAPSPVPDPINEGADTETNTKTESQTEPDSTET